MWTNVILKINHGTDSKVAMCLTVATRNAITTDNEVNPIITFCIDLDA